MKFSKFLVACVFVSAMQLIYPSNAPQTIDVTNIVKTYNWGTPYFYVNDHFTGYPANNINANNRLRVTYNDGTPSRTVFKCIANPGNERTGPFQNIESCKFPIAATPSQRTNIQSAIYGVTAEQACTSPAPSLSGAAPGTWANGTCTCPCETALNPNNKSCMPDASSSNRCAEGNQEGVGLGRGGSFY